MKFNYNKDTDTMYINFKDESGIDSYEIAEDYIVDVDKEGKILGIEILNVTDKFDFKSIVFNSLPLSDIKFISQSSI